MWLELVNWLALIVVLAGGGGGWTGKTKRDPGRPWMLYHGDGSIEVDMTDPQWQASFRKQLKQIRAAQQE